MNSAPPDGGAALRAIGWPFPGVPEEAGDPAWAAAMAAHPQARPARVMAQHRSGYLVAEGPVEGGAVESLPEWQRPKFPPEQRPAVGDWVLVEEASIVALLPRRSVIKRGAAGEHYRQQVIAANVDVVLVVCGLDADFNPRRIERYLLLVRGGGAQPVVVLTKADRADADVDAALAALAGVAGADVPVLAVDARDRDSVAVLETWLRPGVSAVLVGSSGAGKSTLTNSLLGSERMKTGEVRSSDERGRHTTTHRALIPLPSGACLIDTPGMRELKPTGEEDLAEGGFAEVEALAQQCRFRDCRHEQEPGCAVRAAIESGALDPARYASYLKLRDEVGAAAGKLAGRRGSKRDEKALGKAPNKRLDDRYGKR
ncbi:ribosome small subunit-dependent GTPase A [Luteimonas sp. RD2P54]|uniref:Small ribosomal subunit biogenesis GTPase RsgA n=1 Tax=Luteimonas endophytica TaxID=3042023 RepID=A0ABT6JCS7_9GAMM|nr:ribosome small subunit-dependent GTPase A [Luteimonas endophytica]MDH5824635.1 ribosome small subunit-dependent GTPase A [Luteimonas endophytica]